MQTKKRAKPVKFGKQVKKETTPKPTEAEEVKVSEHITKEAAEADINSDEAKEIKQIIEEKTHPKDEDFLEGSGQDEEEDRVEKEIEEEADDIEEKDADLPEQEETTEDEPEEIRLSEDPPEKKEEQMALESTDPALEVEPEEFHEKQKDEESSEEDNKASAFGSFTKEEVISKPRKKGYFGFFLIVASITFLIGLGVIAGVSYLWPTDAKNSVTIPTLSSTTPTPTTEPTATPTPEEVDLTVYPIRVLNGSGITGEAAAVRTLLEEKGFEVASIGNAATSDYTKTVISAKDDVEESYLNELIKVLQDEYSVNSVVEDAPSSQTVDVVVTVGSTEAE